MPPYLLGRQIGVGGVDSRLNGVSTGLGGCVVGVYVSLEAGYDGICVETLSCDSSVSVVGEEQELVVQLILGLLDHVAIVGDITVNLKIALNKIAQILEFE